jgi:hypothetical protein
MNVLLLLAIALLVLAPRLAQCDEGKPLNLQIKPKALLVGPGAQAPFSAQVVEEGHPLDLAPAAPQRDASRSACGVDSSWCYEMNGDGGRSLSYKPARRFMPQFNGLTAENISVKRDRIVFRYSFR